MVIFSKRFFKLVVFVIIVLLVSNMVHASSYAYSMENIDLYYSKCVKKFMSLKKVEYNIKMVGKLFYTFFKVSGIIASTKLAWRFLFESDYYDDEQERNIALAFFALACQMVETEYNRYMFCKLDHDECCCHCNYQP